jgi:hypothetical protein
LGAFVINANLLSRETEPGAKIPVYRNQLERVSIAVTGRRQRLARVWLDGRRDQGVS